MKKSLFLISIVSICFLFLLPNFDYVKAQNQYQTPIAPEIGGSSNSNSGGWIQCANPPDCTFKDFMNTVNYIIQRLIVLALIFVSIIFAAAGFTYLTAGGDSSKIKKAHSMLTKAAVGFAIVLSGYLIVELIATTLGLESAIINFN